MINSNFITSRTLEARSPKSDEVIAEIGPGNGALSESLVKALGVNGKYYGIERSEVMANEARQRLSKGDCAVDIICSDCANANISEISLDGIMAVNLLYFIENIDELFSLVTQWMKPGARAVFGIRSEQSLNSMPFTQ